MTARRTASLILGLVLLAAVYLVGSWRQWTRARDEPGVRTLRLVHFQLESGVREAFDEAAAAYMALHPDVRVETMAVPDRAYRTWLRVQLIGGNPPDLVQLNNGVREEMLARYFLPLTAASTQPNPYLAGTDFAATPWRDTFHEGMRTAPAYVPNLIEVYGAPTAVFTVRLLVNAALWRELLGDRPYPTTITGWLEVAQAIRTATAQRPVPLQPVAGSVFAGNLLFGPWLETATQLPAQHLPSSRAWWPADHEVRAALARGRWSLDDPAPLAGFELLRAVGTQAFQPGFIQVGREDATMAFVQGRAVMMPAGLWDLPSLRAQADFPIDVALLPQPAPGQPPFGEFMRGPLSELRTGAQGVFGIPAAAPHPDLALDFLHFFTSREINGRFAARSSWYPAVLGAPLTPEAAAFAPREEGFPGGLGGLLSLQGADRHVQRVLQTEIHRLFRPDGSAAEFARAVSDAAREAARADTERTIDEMRATLARQDAQLHAWSRLADAAVDDSPARFAAYSEGQLQQEILATWLAHELTAE